MTIGGSNCMRAEDEATRRSCWDHQRRLKRQEQEFVPYLEGLGCWCHDSDGQSPCHSTKTLGQTLKFHGTVSTFGPNSNSSSIRQPFHYLINNCTLNNPHRLLPHLSVLQILDNPIKTSHLLAQIHQRNIVPILKSLGFGLNSCMTTPRRRIALGASPCCPLAPCFVVS